MNASDRALRLVAQPFAEPDAPLPLRLASLGEKGGARRLARNPLGAKASIEDYQCFK